MFDKNSKMQLNWSFGINMYTILMFVEVKSQWHTGVQTWDNEIRTKTV